MSSKEIKTRQDLIELIEFLSSDAKGNLSEWENKDLPSYFEAMASWIEDMDII